MNIKELTDEQLFDEISAIIEERLGVSASDITPDKNLTNDLGADSLAPGVHRGGSRRCSGVKCG